MSQDDHGYGAALKRREFFDDDRGTRAPRILCFTAIFAILLISWSSYSFIKAQEQQSLRKSLETVVATTGEAVAHWAHAQNLTVETWANAPFVNQMTAQLLQVPADKTSLKSSAAQDALRTFFQPVTMTPGYEGYFILNQDNIAIASTRDSNLGVINILATNTRLLERVREGQTLISPPVWSDVPLLNTSGKLTPNRMTMFALTPLRNTVGDVKAILMLRINPFHEFTNILTRGRLGDSGETYGVNEQGRLVTESRFNDQLEAIGLIAPNSSPVLTLQVRDPGQNLLTSSRTLKDQNGLPLTFMAQEMTTKKAPGYQVQGYRDYRGVTVIGAWAWLDDLDFGITTEIDRAEAYVGLRLAAIFIFGSTVTLTLLCLLVTHYYLGVKQQARLADARAMEAADSDRLKSEFLSTMSHEIRTPMNGILGMLSLIRSGDLPEKARGQADIAWQSGESLLHLLNDILDYTKLESGKVELVNVAFSPQRVLEEVISVLAPDAHARKIDLICQTPETLLSPIRSDPNRVRQILTNLIHNAIKFNEGGSVTAKVSLRPGENGTPLILRFDIADTGIGIAEGALETIFDRFQQEDATTTRKYGGTGLGLAICRQLVEVMGGELGVESRLGHGSTFSFTIPVHKAIDEPEASHAYTQVAAS